VGPRKPFRETSKRCITHQGAGKQRPYYGRALVVIVPLARTSEMLCIFVAQPILSPQMPVHIMDASFAHPCG